MYLLDTNVWIQTIRERESSDVVRRLLEALPLDQIHISIYSVHSIGVIMSRFGTIAGYSAFLTGASIGEAVRIVSIPIPQMGPVVRYCIDYKLDFDDAYQYVVAEQNGLQIISLDTDFDRTPRGRLTPAAALAHYLEESGARTPPQP